MTDAKAFNDEAAVDGFGAALFKLGASVARRPWRTLPAAARFTADVAAATVRTTALALGRPARPVVEPPPKDRRFADPSWQSNPWFFGTGQMYLAWSRFMRDVAALAGSNGLDDTTAGKARFAVDAIVDAAAPTNYLPTNPEALRKAVETRGASLRDGLRNLADDLATNGGRPSQVDRSAFRLGENLAATSGQVVFRNDLMELIQYAPQTETVYETPLLLSPPWINKYYIMDLAPGRSFVEHAVQQGHTVFAISYRNPDESMRNVTLDDYLLHGLKQAVDTVRAITGQEQVNVAGLCVGGTLAVGLLAYLAHDSRDTKPSPIRSVTLLNTLVDFSEPGPLGCFTDPAAVEGVEARMAERGFLDADEMASTFDFLRANDLIWNYVASGWLRGERPPAFDILAWNADSTRVSEATHSFYLRACYLENQLAKGQMTLAGRLLDLDEIDADAYVLAAKEDHITPWTGSYATTGLLPRRLVSFAFDPSGRGGRPASDLHLCDAEPPSAGPSAAEGGLRYQPPSRMRFVLSSSGHIAGIVNPPTNKRRYWTNDDLPPDPQAWLADATEHSGSWWGDWTEWIAARAGTRQNPPATPGNSEYPPLIEAPGTYVRSEMP
ncbi:MAG: PHA/PHB synthase family protein [Acidimicrobiales bacterium]